MNRHIGSTFDSFLEEHGIKEEVDALAKEKLAKKKMVSSQIKLGMERRSLTKKLLAERMGTSRTVVYRLLDPADTSVTLDTLVRALNALGMDLLIGPKQTIRTAVTKRRQSANSK